MINIAIEIFLYAVCYTLGRVILPIITLGRCYAGAIIPTDIKDIRDYKWYGVRQVQNGRYEFSEGITELIGFIALIVAIATALYLFFLRAKPARPFFRPVTIFCSAPV